MLFLNDNGTLRSATTAVHTADSPAALYGDGLFETIRFAGGGMLLWGRHWARLSAGMDALLFPRSAGWSADFFAEQIMRTVDASGLMDGCRVRLQVYVNADDDLRFAIVCGALPPQPAAVGLGISTSATKEPGPLSRLKTCSALPYRVAAREASQKGWDDAVLLNSAGDVVETTRCNVALWRKGIVFFNPLADGPVSGVMRDQLVEWMREQGYAVEESSFSAEALYGADEIFLTNALRGVMPVKQLFSHSSFGERTLSTHFGEGVARMVEQKFIASVR